MLPWDSAHGQETPGFLGAFVRFAPGEDDGDQTRNPRRVTPDTMVGSHPSERFYSHGANDLRR